MTELEGSDASARSAGSRIAVIEKAVRTLDALLPVPAGLTPTEVAKAIGTNRSTAFRLLTSLELTGLLAREPATGRYQLGIKLLQYGAAVRNSMSIVRIAEPTLMNLRDQTRQSVLLSIREQWGARCLFRLPGPEVDVLSWTTGEWLPMHMGAAPQALLSALSDTEIESYLDHTTDWHTLNGDRTADDIRQGIAVIRERGWALNRETLTRGVASLGTVVRDAAGAVVCAISVAGLVHHYDGQELDRTAAAILRAAQEISSRLE
ncbi:IclR family transcriptional regulator [Pseudonocardia sp. NPDC049635]|uniref:IclR family transcriptional regulator n=1 Tax=Pseudonocardia sp. NPDC049635 TaxID=3155506 RepID=UPI0034059E58